MTDKTDNMSHSSNTMSIDLNYIDQDDMFSKLYDNSEINKLFLKIYIRYYLKVINKIRIRSKIININSRNKPSGDDNEDASIRDLDMQLRNAYKRFDSAHKYDDHLSVDLFFTFLYGNKECKQLTTNSNIIPAFCKYTAPIVAEEFEQNKVSNIEKLLTVITALYTLHNSTMGVDNTKIQQLKTYASNLREILVEEDANIDYSEYLKILSYVHEFISENKQ
tara:strand:- start:7942 stop:8604 length:663 start_codon:yes stop_codon:yes gene_type:complete